MAETLLAKYHSLSDQLLEESRKRYAFEAPQMQALLGQIAVLLRIGKIEIFKTPIMKQQYLHGDLNVVFYQSSNYDEDQFTTLTYTTETVISVKTRFYRIKGEPDWTEEEYEIIKLFEKTLFALNGWFTLISYMNYCADHDDRFPVYKLRKVFMEIDKKIQDKSIERYAAIFFNVQRFAFINKQITDEAGTVLLGRYFKIIESAVGSDGLVGSLGGDNGVALFRKELVGDLLQIMNGVSLDVEKPDGRVETIALSAHVGLNMDLTGFDTPREIVNSIGVAMQSAKKKPGRKLVEYDGSFRDKVWNRQFIEQIFKDALEKEEFSVYYQPKVNLHDYSLCGAEALVRWKHNGSMIYPDQFIPILESNYSIKFLDMYMLNHVCADLRRWMDEGRNVKTVSVNLSRCSMDIDNLVSVISGIIDSHNIPRSLIQIELTESSSEVGARELQELVVGLRDANITTAVDDFGTGFSSLSLIRDYPWTVLKIDKSILHGALFEGSRENFMFKSIISLANGLGLECIVEGVETREEVQLLKNCGCFLAQGYFFDRPITREEFAEKL